MGWFPDMVVRLFLHVIAASIWVGGQLIMIGLLPMLRARGSDVARAVGTAYNRLAWPAYAVLVATGIWNILSRDFSTTHSMIILSVKLAMVLLSGLGAASHQIVVSHMKESTLRTVILASGATMSTICAVAAMYLGLLLRTS